MIIFFVELHQDVVLEDRLVVREMSHLQNLKLIQKWEMLTKNYDD